MGELTKCKARGRRRGTSEGLSAVLGLDAHAQCRRVGLRNQLHSREGTCAGPSSLWRVLEAIKVVGNTDDKHGNWDWDQRA